MAIKKGKKPFFFVIGKGRNHVAILLVIILLVVAACAVIFAGLTHNPLKDANIIIDPGHGGTDNGATDNEYFFEKDVNLQISRKLQTELDLQKAFASLTRNEDISLDHQVDVDADKHKKDLVARVNHFNSGAYDLFISIHVNSSSSSRAIGPMVLYSPDRFENAFLAQCVQKRLNEHAKKVMGEDIKRSPVKSEYYILKHSDIPGVLVETGFMSNPSEKALLRDEDYQKKLSGAIALGIRDYLSKVEKARESSEDVYMEEEYSPPFNITNEVQMVNLSPSFRSPAFP